MDNLIVLDDCMIGEAGSPALRSASFSIARGEAVAFVGPAGGGKEALAAALAGSVRIVPNEGGAYRTALSGNAVAVSFSASAALAKRERDNDDSDFAEGGVSEGTSVRAFVASGLHPDEASRYPEGAGLERHPAALSCGVSAFIDRGLKRLSTGEIRRALLCRAIASRPGLIVMDGPYDGLDADARRALVAMLDGLASGSRGGAEGAPLLVVVDRFERLPAAVNRIVEVSDGRVSFSGSRSDYEARLASTAIVADRADDSGGGSIPLGLGHGDEFSVSAGLRRSGVSSVPKPGDEALIELRNVTVSWSGRRVLDRLSWKVMRGEHWLVRGPNGSGKTTLLELISGDNPQAYANDVRVFGQRRGSGGSIWELKSRLGIVSYRLHLEYRYLGDMRLEDVLVSGLRDSIGLYEETSDEERRLAAVWLAIAGFGGRGSDRFGGLSFGEQRALLVARAAVKAPELLILDEPCHGLDDAQRRFVFGLMAEIARRGETTMLHVTHDPDEVLPFERRVLELRPGATPSWAVSAPLIQDAYSCSL